MNIFGALPTSLLQMVFESNSGMQTGFTALLGSKNVYQLNGNSIVSIHPLIGTTFNTVGKDTGNGQYVCLFMQSLAC
jgi:hypothetical protein